MRVWYFISGSIKFVCIAKYASSSLKKYPYKKYTATKKKYLMVTP
jgi:hypothetical protein